MNTEEIKRKVKRYKKAQAAYITLKIKDVEKLLERKKHESK